MNDYTQYSPEVQQWMAKIISTLTTELNEIPVSYEVSLDLLADALETYIQAKNEIRTNGIIITGRQGDRVKSPAISVLNSSQLFISKLLSNFALTRMAKSKLKENTDGLSAQELLDALTK